MAYFLKKTKNKKGLYLQIYESYYHPERKQTVHKSYKPLGYEHELKEQGIKDPIEHFQAEVKKLNEKRNEARNVEKTRRISDSTPDRYLGHFPLRAINEGLGVRKEFSYFQMASKFRFSLFDMLSDLIYARAVSPCSKRKTHLDVLPMLAGANHNYSLDQLYDGIEWYGSEYQKIIEIYNNHVSKIYPFDTSKTYFDCTNFYFEIDREDELRRKGPSKENRKDPIVGMGLLLNKECLPIGMTIYPGNQSEIPVMRETIDTLKRRRNIQGRTIRVADKGLNCIKNILDAQAHGDGYIFSKSIKKLPAQEKAYAITDKGFVDIKDENGNVVYRLKSVVDTFDYNITYEDGTSQPVPIKEKRLVSYNPKLARKQKAEIARQVDKALKLNNYQAKKKEYGDSAKYVIFAPVDKNGEAVKDAKVAARLNHKAIKEAKELAGYNMIVTSETTMSDNELYQTYHELWHIEETFRTMKSQLDARPVYTQKHDSIVGHFLICYLTVLLERLLQMVILKQRYSTGEVMRFIREFRVVQKSDRQYINASKSAPIIDDLEKMTNLPLNNYYLNSKDIKEILSLTLPMPSPA